MRTLNLQEYSSVAGGLDDGSSYGCHHAPRFYGGQFHSTGGGKDCEDYVEALNQSLNDPIIVPPPDLYDLYEPSTGASAAGAIGGIIGSRVAGPAGGMAGDAAGQIGYTAVEYGIEWTIAEINQLEQWFTDQFRTFGRISTDGDHETIINR